MPDLHQREEIRWVTLLAEYFPRFQQAGPRRGYELALVVLG
jgi:hypothetical protein